MKHLPLYFILSVLSAFFVVLPFLNETPINTKLIVLYAIFCSSIFVYVPKKKSILKFIGIEILVVLSWGLLWISVLKLSKDIAVLSWVISVNFFSFILASLPSRFFSFLVMLFAFNSLPKYRTIGLRIIGLLTLVPCLYLLSAPLLIKKVRQERNFLNTKPAQTMVSKYLEAKKIDRERCYDRLYEAADIRFVESMLIVSQVEKHKSIKAITAIEEGTNQLEVIDPDRTYEIADCFYVGKVKYYLLRSDQSEYAIEESDLDFSAKEIVTGNQLLKEAFIKNDLETFRKILQSREFKQILLISEIIEADAIEFFKAFYKTNTDRSLTVALSAAKQGSEILKFAMSQPIKVEQASTALKAKIYHGSAEEIKMLLEKGASFFFDTGDQQLPILGVVRNKENFEEIIDLYLSSGGDINFKSARGESLFLRAESIKQIDYLLSKGADINDSDDDGMNLLLRLSQFQNNP